LPSSRQSRPQRFPDLLWRQVQERPRAIAAAQLDGRSIRWAQLGERVLELAERLRQLGVGPEVPVGVCLDRSIDLVVALLGVHEAGGTFVPLDPGLPDARLAWLVEDAGIAVAIAEAKTAGRVEVPTLLRLDLPRGAVKARTTAGRGQDGPTQDGPATGAYVIYTSGSTGEPKGVVVEHRSLLALAEALPPRFGATPRSRLIQYSSIAFDVCFFDFSLWLGSGARLLLAPAARLVPGPELHRTLAEGRITHLTCTPTVLSALSPRGLPTLRHLMVGGEPLPPDLVARFGPGRALHNVYGPTEATVAATAFLTTGTAGWPPVGSPIGEATVRVADPSGASLPAGESGEILLGGPGVARGYLGRPERTAEAFWTDPDSGERLYRTGDLGHLEPDGTLVFEGRVDAQVKVRGVRVEPAEVEVVLRGHPEVQEAVVIARSDGGPTRLVAYVVPTPGAPGGPAPWRHYLAERLPEALVPTAFVRLAALPLLPSSKVDRAALPAPSGERPELLTPYAPPQSPLEEALAARVAELVGVSPVGADDDFFALGGDSLASIRLLADIAEEHGAPLPPAAFAKEPTVRAMARALRVERGAAASPVLSSAQLRQWFQHRLAPESINDHLPAMIHLDGPLDPERLRAAFASLVERHEALRTVIEVQEGRPAPRLLPPSAPALAPPALESLPTGDEASAILHAELQRPFDLSREPAWRARLLQRSPTEHRLALVFHHIAVDAASLGLLVRELAALLDGRSLPPAGSPAARALREQPAAESGELDASLAWWQARLHGAPAWSGLPVDRAPLDGPREGARRSFRIPPEELSALRERGRAQGATPFQALLAAFSEALRACGAGPELVIGTPVADRSPAVDPCVGFFANTVPIRLSERPASEAQAFRLARTAALDAIAHADAPIDRVVAACAPPRSPGRTPLFQVLLALQDPLPRARTREGVEIEVREVVAEVAPIELTVELWPDAEGGLDGAALYDARLYDAGSIDTLLRQLRAQVRGLAATWAADRPVAQVRGRPLDPPDDPLPSLAHALPRSAERHGEHTLCFVESTGLEIRRSYRTLLGEAQAFACGLRALGLGPGERMILQQDGLHAHTVAFWGCLLAGLLPMSLAVPASPGRASLDKLAQLARRLGATVLASPALREGLSRSLPSTVPIRCVDPLPGWIEPPRVPSSEVAFYQASSGTTGAVKIIPLTHRAALRHVQAATAHSGYSAQDRTLSWLPFDHVASLLMCHIKDTVLGAHQVHLRTELVLADPLRLFDRVHSDSITHLLSPNFGYGLLLEALDRQPERRWDLRSLRRIANGAETVRLDTTRAFLQRTAAFGLDPRAMQPGFGMAETASVVTFDNDFSLERSVRYLRRASLEGPLAFASGPGPGVLPLLSLGGPLPGVELRVVDEQGALLPEAVVGALQVRGEVVFSGYLDDPEASAALAPDGWFDTGDRGFLLEGRLSLVGRAKDTIVVRGAKLLAEEVEQLLLRLPGLAAGGVAACAVPEADGEGEELVVLLVPRAVEQASALCEAARAMLTEELGVAPARVLAVSGEALPRTSAGKLQRRELTRRLAAGELAPLSSPMAEPEISFYERVWSVPPEVDSAAAAQRFVPGGGDLEAELAALGEAVRQADGRLRVAAGRDALVDAALAGALACLRWERPELDLLPGAATELLPTTPRPGADSPFAPGGRWLITGGLGGVGRLLGRHLLDRYGAHLLLVGRSPAAAELLQPLEAMAAARGGSVRYAQADVALVEELGAALRQAEAAWNGRLDGALHLAGVLEERRLDELDRAHLQRALRAKVDGTRVLGALLDELPEAWLVLFSSTAGSHGAAGAGAYAAACRFQEAWAAQQRGKRRSRVRALAFGAWADTGLSQGRPAGASLPVDRALEALERCLVDGRDLLIEAAPPRTARSEAAAPGEAELRARISTIWKDLLKLETVDPEASFFALGGHSVLLVQAQARIQAELGRELPITELFRHPTLAGLSRALADGGPSLANDAARSADRPRHPVPEGAIAIIGMAGRFPGAPDVDTLWENLCAGRGAARTFSDRELAASGVPEAERHNPRYVPVRAVLDGVGDFDEAFFGMSPAEAAGTDPQHRLFLECAWEALEDAGVDPSRPPGDIGVFAGSGLQGYLPPSAGRSALARLGQILGNDKDHLAPRVAYKLDLRGPAVTVQTACSTSLVAVHQACQELRAGGCEVALAGGVNIGFPLNEGYLYQEGHIVSPDGRCRAFDQAAAGTFGGDGAGVVVLMRAERALAEGYTVHALIRGTATNNDGAAKAAYTAPGVEGQARVIRAAVAAAGVAAESIGYIEAHGTGTALGDPIEVAALGLALGPRAPGAVRWLGAIKPNLGHGNAAAGVAALIKAARVVERGLVPPVLHLQQASPRLDLEAASLRPSPRLERWEESPRRAGVSAFGFGGTNAHIVLEQAPRSTARTEPALPLLPLSARSPEALEASRLRLAAHLRAHPELSLDAVASTLQRGRRSMACRAVYRGLDEAPIAVGQASSVRSVAFLFPGQGAQHPGMLRALYAAEGRVRELVDLGARRLRPSLGLDLRELLLAAPEDAGAARQLGCTELAQPALLLAELALAGLWMAQGVQLTALLGHSLGEWAAGVVAGVFTLEDGLDLVAARGALCAQTAPGAMLSVALGPDALRSLLGQELEIAVENGPRQTVVAGPALAVAELHARLASLDIPARLLPGTCAFHSRAMEPVERELLDRLRRVPLSSPRLRLISGVTGRWMSEAEAVDPARWARQAVAPVRFGAALETLRADPELLLVEVGPGRTLSALVAQRDRSSRLVLPGGGDPEAFQRALASAWTLGVPWSPPGPGRRVPLPTAPFQRRRHWIEAARGSDASPERADGSPQASSPGPLPRRIGIVGSDPALEALKELLVIRGAELSWVPHGDAAQLTEWLEGLRMRGQAPDALLVLDPSLHDAAALLQALARRMYRTPLDLTALTRGALASAPHPRTELAAEAAATAALLGGADRVLPLARTRVLDVGSDAPLEPSELVGALGGPVGSLVHREGHRFEASGSPSPLEVDRPGHRLIFDGPAGEGLAAAEALVEQGAEVVLVPWEPGSPDLSALEGGLDQALAVRPIDATPGLRQGLEELCAALAHRFLIDGPGLVAGSRFTRGELRDRLSIRPAFHRLLDAMVRILRADGYLLEEGASLRVTERVAPDPEQLGAALRRDHPRMSGLVDLLEHCARHYSEALSGRIEAIGVLYPGGASTLVEDCDRRTAEHRQDRRQILLLTAALRRLATEQGSVERPFRVLEFGGGQGLLTWPLVQALSDLPVDLHVTDIGTAFVEDARREAGRRGLLGPGPGLRLRVDRLDISQPADTRRFPQGSYDAILAYNVLHAVSDLPAVLRQLRPLLAPGGQLAAVEILRTERWDTMTWGLAEGWWSYDDAVRTEGPLLSLSAWERLLQGEGYLDPAAWPRPGDERAGADHGLLLARAPGTPRGRSRESRLRALTEHPTVRVLPSRTAIGPALAAASEAFGAPAAVLVEAPVDGFPPLLATPPEQLGARIGAAVDGLAALDAGLGGIPAVLLTRVDDPHRGPIDRALEAWARGAGWSTRALAAPARERLPPAAAPHAREATFLPPRTPLESTVAAVAAEVLGLERIGRDEDFVDLGVDSLIMLRMTDRLAAELGRPVPGEVAFRGSSVERLAQALDEEASPAGSPAEPPDVSPLVQLQARGHKTPFFFVHPATGVVFPYYRLARELGEDRPFYGLQALGLDGLAPVDTRIEDMARHYIAAIRRVQPRGPYHIGGFSFGCLVAHEIAVQLALEGEPPGLVALLDEPAPIDGYRPSPALMARMIARGARESLLPFLPEYLALRREGERSGLEWFLARATLSGFFPEEQRPVAMRQPALLKLFELFLLHGRLTMSYEPRAYPHRLTLLKATDLRGRAARDPTQGWRMLAAGGVEVHRLPGEHLTLLREPHVREVARVLRSCLARAEEGELNPG